MTRVWVVRAGSQGSLIELVQRESVVVIGWGELGDLAAIPDQETLRARVDEIYAGDSGASLSKHFSQTRAFRFDMEQGDLVIAPGPQGRDLLVGRVVGDCEYRPRLPPEAQQVRPVEWLGSFRRHDVKEDLQNTLGSLLTVFEVKQAGASDRFLAVISGGSDPGSLVGETTEKRQAQLKRLRAALQTLADEPMGLHKDEVYRRAVEVVPLVEGEEGTVTGGRPAAQVTLEWMSTNLAFAAWMTKFNGQWRITRSGRQALEDYRDPVAMWDATESLAEELGLKTPDPEPTADELAARIQPQHDDYRVRRLARAMLVSGLGSGRSTIDPQVHAWSAQTVDELYGLYSLHPDESDRKFLEKLRDQLAEASDAAILLAAELLTLHQLQLVNLTDSTKRDRVRTILSWADEVYSPTTEMYWAFQQGSWSGGQGAHTLIFRVLHDWIDFLREWWTRDETVRAQALADPWAWNALIENSGALTMASQREALRYLAFPHHFLSITSIQHKTLIAEAFRYEVGAASGDLNRDLFDITVALQKDSGGGVEYYKSPWLELWTPPPRTGRAWLVRGSGVSGRNLIPDWIKDGFVSLPAANLPHIQPPYDRRTVHEAIGEAHSTRNADYRRRKTLDYSMFLHDMKAEDIVVTQAEGQVWVGTVTGEPVWDDDNRAVSGLRRSVTWEKQGYVRSELSESLSERLKGIQNDVTDISDGRDALAQLIVETGGDDATDDTVVELPPADLSAPSQAVADSLYMPLDWLERFTATMRRRKQAILFGPPGTGKTYLARKLAEHWADADNVTLVQFHPSVSYEDFIAGYRPEAGDGGGVGFVLRQGPFMRLAERAKDDPGNPYVLIIDEINRANLAKVFGELYFLLEYRDAPIEPLYADDSSKQFTLPPNVYIIGTMNTADRSIALVDAAMRRRFAFLEMHPDSPPVQGVLRDWLAANELPGESAELLDALNARIPHRDFAIGPSYFMRDWIYSEDGGLDEVWETDLLPLLEEHHAGEDLDVRALYGLAVLRRAIGSAQDEHE